jgi:hypothetical protein
VAGVSGALRRRLEGTFTVDPWGLDADLVGLVAPAARIRWDIEARGNVELPAGPFALVVNRRLGVTEPWVVAEAVRRLTGRHLRFVGVPDVAPVGPALRRFGGVVNRADEIAGLLRAGEAVGLWLDHEPLHRRRAGALHPEALAPVVRTGAPVVPVAADGRELGRRWTITFGEPLEPAVHSSGPSERGTGPLAAADLADQTRAAIQALLDQQ